MRKVIPGESRVKEPDELLEFCIGLVEQLDAAICDQFVLCLVEFVHSLFT